MYPDGDTASNSNLSKKLNKVSTWFNKAMLSKLLLKGNWSEMFSRPLVRTIGWSYLSSCSWWWTGGGRWVLGWRRKSITFLFVFLIYWIIIRIKKGIAQDRSGLEKTDLDALFSKLGCPYDLLNIVKEVNKFQSYSFSPGWNNDGNL